jgi:hypothetical protein
MLFDGVKAIGAGALFFFAPGLIVAAMIVALSLAVS